MSGPDEQDPLRLFEDPETAASLRSAFEEARDLAPDEATAARIEAALGPILGGPGGSGGGGASGSAQGGAATASGGSFWGWIVGPAVVAAIAAGALGFWLVGAESESPRTDDVVSRQDDVVLVKQEAIPPVDVAASPQDVAERQNQVEEDGAGSSRRRKHGARGRARKVHHRPNIDEASDPRASSSGEEDGESSQEGPTELMLLSQARRALPSNPARSLELTRERARRFPRGHLAQEGEIIAIDALVRLGRLDTARTRGRRFLNGYPRSAHRARLEQLLGIQ